MGKRILFVISIGILLLSAGSALGLEISPTADPAVLVDSIKGTGISILGTPTFTGGEFSCGTFTGGTAAGLGFESGILLTTGDAALMDGPNKNMLDPEFTPETLGVPGNDWDTYTALDLPGDPQLTELSGFDTFDAAVLEFDFLSVGGDLYFNYVFASEEYVNYVDTDFNDVFGFWVDGVNLAVVPGTDTPITVNTINPRANSQLYRNNIDYIDDEGALVPAGGIDVEFDGLTQVLSAVYEGLAPGSHHMKIAIADASDPILDAGVYIQAGTFSDQPSPVPEPSSLLLLCTGAGAMLALGRRRGSQGTH